MIDKKKINLLPLKVTENQIFLNYGIGDYSFQTIYTYENLDLHKLAKGIGECNFEKICFHMLLFEANKLLSLGASSIDAGIYSKFISVELAELWNTCGENIWAQWRYQNNKPNYKFAKLVGQNIPSEPIDYEVNTEKKYLVFCGGGKDSLLMAELLNSSGEKFDSLGYSIDFYGSHDLQRKSIESLSRVVNPGNYSHLYIQDTFMSSPILNVDKDYDYKELIGGETPSSLFSAIPYVLANGYSFLVLGNEKSADFGNLNWDKEAGREINHQWGKSFEAESLLSDYISTHLLKSCKYFSLLKPFRDPAIFKALGQFQEKLEFTHSCNVKKPWCKKCPKCAYVWLSYMAYFSKEVVDPIFDGDNLFDFPENQKHYSMMLGLEDHLPFECIGQVAEAKLAFGLCNDKGYKGEAMTMFKEVFPAELTTHSSPSLEKLGKDHNIPSALWKKLVAGVLKGFELE